jgi:hypothetical protein
MNFEQQAAIFAPEDTPLDRPRLFHCADDLGWHAGEVVLLGEHQVVAVK